MSTLSQGAQVRRSAALAPAPTPPHLSALPAMREWLRTAAPGSKRVYHIGYLIVDRGFLRKINDMWQFQQVEPLHSIALLMQEAEKQGEVYLLQRRLGDSEYIYYAVKRRKRR